MSESITLTFGAWLKLRRRVCDVTQKQLARQLGVAEITIRKIEADQLRPSKHLADLMLEKLEVPRGERSSLVQLARRNGHSLP